MRILSLNIWGGQLYDPLMKYLDSHRSLTDIFCFQEIYSFDRPGISRGTRLNIYEEIARILPDHQGSFYPIQSNIDDRGAIDIPAVFGQAMFVRRTLLPLEEAGFVFSFGGPNVMQGDDFATLGGGFQYALLTVDAERWLILNVHGTSQPGDKLDTPQRIAQARRIREFVLPYRAKKVVCGDFNLEPSTESINISGSGLRNLIGEYGVQNTRGRVNAMKYEVPQYFADYALVSPDIAVDRFEVPEVEISDHLPLVLECR